MKKLSMHRSLIRVSSRSALIFVFASLITGCIDSYEVKELKVERDRLNASINKCKKDNEIQGAKVETWRAKVDTVREKAAKPLETNRNIDLLIQQRRETSDEIDFLEQRLRGAWAVLKACQESFTPRIGVSIGDRHESFKLSNGRELTNVEIKDIKGTKINLSHAGGIGVFDISEMPSEIQRASVLPPPSPFSTIDPGEILRRRPDSTKNPERIKRDQQNELAAEQARRETEAAVAKNEQDAKIRAESEERKRSQARREQITQELTVIRQSISNHQNNYRQIEIQIDEMKRKWNSGSIKLSQVDQERYLKKYYDQLRQITAAINSLQSKAEQLQNEITKTRY